MSQLDEGVRIVLSPVQLAAVLADDSVSESESVTNRLWGGARLLGGIVELAGAGVLCLAPEPTMVSKAGCVVFGVHGADTASSGVRQMWTGRDVQSLTEQGAAAFARALGADRTTAQTIGVAVDIAVPLAMAAWVGAARIAAVRAGRISLAAHEAQSGSRVGGHTILKHVGKTEAELRARLAAERIPAASSFSSLRRAEQVISAGLRAHAGQIQAWAQQALASGGRTANLRIVYDAGSVVGQTVLRATNRLASVSRVQIVLKFETYNGMPYYILTAFPIP